MDLTEYRASCAEQQRTADLLRLMPTSGKHALDIGARDGHFAILMADRFNKVTALDLTEPNIVHPKVQCIEGSAAKMPFCNGSFDFVFCAEVLEHIPTAILSQVCREIERVASQRILIGVPYKQDIRVGRTTCYSCGNVNPPWGHTNSFDEKRVMELFGRCAIASTSFVGTTSLQTNSLSAILMNLAGNPYGTYDQEEVCIHCGKRLLAPPERTPAQRVATKFAFWSRKATDALARPHGNWMHVVLRRMSGA